MNDIKILIAGLPNAGKTTYIAALNGAIQQEGNFHLSYVGKTSEIQYVNKVTTQWLEGKMVDHSTDDEPKYINWPLKKNDDVINIIIPDMKGEMYQDIINNDFNEGLSEFCKDASGVFFFINDIVKPVLKDHVQNIVSKDETNGNKQEESDVSLSIEKMNDVVKAILVLKYLRNLIGDVRLAVAVSSWDMIETTYPNIEEYMKSECSALYNYVIYNFKNYKFFGVSAQGLNYNEHMDSLDNITSEGKRA